MSTPSLSLTPTSEVDIEATHGGPVIMQTMGMPEFSVGLYSDSLVWDALKVIVADPANGATSELSDAIAKFSDYVIKVECKAAADQDGCCLFLTQPDYGGWCLFQDSGNTMSTYRLKHEDTLDLSLSAFSLDQGDYQEAIAAFKVDTTDAANLDYLHYFHCGTKNSSNHVYTCLHY